jgi:hypothetical protein
LESLQLLPRPQTLRNDNNPFAAGSGSAGGGGRGVGSGSNGGGNSRDGLKEVEKKVEKGGQVWEKKGGGRGGERLELEEFAEIPAAEFLDAIDELKPALHSLGLL